MLGVYGMRIAMWSGPRNLSTAMMYAFDARDDCAVVDEPFYASYLEMTGLTHPMRDAILAGQSIDPQDVISQLVGEIPGNATQFYQKHMTQHMIPGIDRSWMQDVTNVFLIRHPARVIASYAKKREGPSLEDIGFAQQAELFDEVQEKTGNSIVIDSTDIRRDPAGMLQKLCAALGLEWDSSMLAWPIGGNEADGIWASHWYGAVHQSTGFAAAEGPLPELPEGYQELLNAAMPHYERLAAYRLT
jgi:hypothetical protein